MEELWKPAVEWNWEGTKTELRRVQNEPEMESTGIEFCDGNQMRLRLRWHNNLMELGREVTDN